MGRRSPAQTWAVNRQGKAMDCLRALSKISALCVSASITRHSLGGGKLLFSSFVAPDLSTADRDCAHVGSPLMLTASP
jgi:hypothetical protein